MATDDRANEAVIWREMIDACEFVKRYWPLVLMGEFVLFLELRQIRRRRRQLLVRQAPVLHQPRHLQPPAHVHLKVTMHEPHACTHSKYHGSMKSLAKDRELGTHYAETCMLYTHLGCRHGSGWRPSRRRARRRCCARRGRRG